MGKAILMLLCATIFHAGTFAFGQQLATLNITVEDDSGSVIPQAQMTLRNIETGARRNDVSDADGRAMFAGLAAGRYRIAVESEQFDPYQARLTLSVGQDASATVKLRIKMARETVDVQDLAQGVDARKSETSQMVGSAQISDLPIAGRDFIDFVLLTPNVNVGRSTAVGAQAPFQETMLELSFAGLRETHSTFFSLDGMDYTTSISGVQRTSPSEDWVMEFRVVDVPTTTDNGRNLGSVVNTVTKSGSNDVHGSVYAFFRNNKIDANNPLSAPGFDTSRFNQFGATLGGPIRRDHLLYFLGYEGQRRAESPLYSSFILHCIDGTGCLGPGTPSINQVKGTLGLSPENLGSILQIQDYDKAFGKLNDAVNNSNTLNAGYIFTEQRNQRIPGAAPGQGLPSFYRNNPIYDQTVYGNWLRVMGTHWTSESLLCFGQRSFHLDPVGAGFEPALLVADLFDSGGIQGGVHEYRETHLQAGENTTYVRGKHALKFGAEIEPVWMSAQTAFFTPGGAIFTPQSFFGAAPFDGAPFGPGTPVQFLFLQPRSDFGRQLPARTLPFSSGLFAGPAASTFANSVDLHFLHELVGVSAQDQWNVGPNLTTTLGVRYDIDFFPSADDLRLDGRMHPTNFGNVQPRAGLAYSFRRGKGVVRAGFGLFTGPFDYSDIMVSWQGASGFTYMNQPVLPEFANPRSALVGLGPSGIVGVNGPVDAKQAFIAFTHAGTYPSPNSLLQFPLGYVERKFPNAYAEQGTLQIENEVAKDWFVSVGYEFVHALKMPLYLSINGVPSGTTLSGVQAFTPADPNFGFALMAAPAAYSVYHGGTLSLRKTFGHHYGIVGNYTFSKSIDLATDVQLTDSPMNYLNPRLDRARGDNDVRHRLVLTLMGETPGTWDRALRGFKLSMLNTLQSPRYYSIFAGFDVNGDGFPFSDRVGTTGRNTYRGDGSYTTDVRIQKVFHWREKLMEASAEVFNLFNRVNVNGIDTVYGAATFVGPVPRYFGDGVSSPTNPTFGTANFAAPARQIQLAVRITF